MNTNIWTNICEYEYKYKKKLKKICACIVYKLVVNVTKLCKTMQTPAHLKIYLYFDIFFLTNTNKYI